MKWVKVIFLSLIITGLIEYPTASMGDEKDQNNKVEVNNETEEKGILWKRGKTPLSDLSPEQKKSLLGGPMEPEPVGPETVSPLEEQLPLKKDKERERVDKP